MMHKSLASLALFISGFWLSAQSTDDIGVWIDHLPYGRGVDIEIDGDKVYTATEQGLFVYDNTAKTVERLSKVNGLSDVGLTALGWSEKYGILVVGYGNGNIDLVQDGEVTNVPAIRQSGSYIGLKRINDIKVYGDLIYISTDFGIVTFNLVSMVAGDTYIISDNGTTMPVNEVILANDSLYAATNEGIRAGALSEPLIFFERWQQLPGRSGRINEIAFFNGELIANKVAEGGDSVFRISNGKWDFIENIEVAGNFDLRSSNGRFTVCNIYSARAYDTDFNLVANVVGTAVDNPTFSPRGAVMDQKDRNLFIADAGGGGLYQNFDRLFTFNLRPNSPNTKNVLELYHGEERLFVAPGAISDVWAPLFNNDGYFVLEDFEWRNVPNQKFNEYKDIVAIVQDPEDTSHLYLSSYDNGILEMRNGELVRVLNEQNTGGAMPSINGSGNHRVGGFATDEEEGDIWFTNSRTDRPLGKISPDGSVQTFALGSAASNATDVKEIIYTSENQVWMQTRSSGIVVARVEGGQVREAKALRATEGSGNLPTERVLAFAEDLDGEIWIGTDEGIAVIYSPVNVFEPNRNYDAQIIVIDEDGDGNGERVLGAETINDIEVDGSNKKWFATATAGVFYTSANGKEQIYRFTAENSPLPSNNVLDIEVDPVTGMVYFGTDQGIVSFQGAATEGANFHADVFAYPNPVEPGYDGPILIRGLVTNAQVKITDIEGNIIYETVAEGGQAIWNGNSFDGRRAASGVYLAYITNDDGSTTAVTKILIVN